MKKIFTLILMISLTGQILCADEFDDLAQYKYDGGGTAEKAFEKLRDLKAEEKKAVEKQLIAVISNKDATQDGKAWACRFLQIIGTDASVPALEGLLGDEVLSHYARLALERMQKSDAAVKALRDALDKVPAKLQVGIAASLGQMRDVNSVTALESLAKKGDAETARAALMALGKIADSKAMKILLKVDPAPETKQAYYDALAECAARTGGKDAVSVYEKLLSLDSGQHRSAGLMGICRTDPSRGSEVLATSLKGKDPVLRKAALTALVTVKRDKLASGVVSVLGDLCPAMQAKVITVLGIRGDKSALNVITAMLKSEDKAVCEAALVFVAKLGDAESVKKLLAMEGIDAGSVKEAIARKAGPDIDKVLISALDDAKTRNMALSAIMERRCAAAVPALLDLTKCDDADFRKNIWSALGALTGEENFTQLVSAVLAIKNEKEIRYGADALRTALGAVTDKGKVFPDVAAAYDRGGDDIKNVILEISSSVGTDDALQLARKGLNSGNNDLAKAAIRGMSSWPNIGAAEDLLKVAKTSNDDTIKILALRGYISIASSPMRISSKERMEILKNGKDLAKRKDEKNLLIAGIGAVKGNDALKMLLDYMDDSELRGNVEATGAEIIKKSRHSTPESRKMAELLLKSKDKRRRELGEAKLKEWDKKKKK